MVRGIHTRKRSGGPIFRRTTKRRRIVFRRRTTGRRTVQGQSSRSLNPRAIGQFRSRKTSARTYRRRIYHNTQFDTHWRSVFDNGATVTTPNDITNSTVTFVNGLPNTAGLEFWTTARGTVPVDAGATVPTFGRNITLRGGISYIRIGNPTPDVQAGGSESIKVTVWCIWTPKTPVLIGFPTQVPQSWDPSTVADFDKNVGRIMFKRDFILGPNNSVEELAFRYRPKRIDRAVFNVGGSQMMWMVAVGQLTATEGTPAAETITIVTGHNVSFAADEV